MQFNAGKQDESDLVSLLCIALQLGFIVLHLRDGNYHFSVPNIALLLNISESSDDEFQTTKQLLQFRIG